MTQQNIQNIKEGSIIVGSYWSEPVLVDLSEIQGDYIKIIGKTQKSKEHIDQQLPLNEVKNIRVINEQISFTNEPWKVFLALEAIRYRYASLYDPLLAMNVSKNRPSASPDRGCLWICTKTSPNSIFNSRRPWCRQDHYGGADY